MSQLLLLVSSTRSMTTRMHSIQLVDRCSANHNVQVHDLERWTPGCTCSGPELLLRCGRTGQVGKRIQSLPTKPTRKPRSRSACGPQARRFHPYPSGPGLRPQVSTPDSIQMSMWKARSMDALAQSPLPSRWPPVLLRIVRTEHPDWRRHGVPWTYQRAEKLSRGAVRQPFIDRHSGNRQCHWWLPQEHIFKQPLTRTTEAKEFPISLIPGSPCPQPTWTLELHRQPMPCRQQEPTIEACLATNLQKSSRLHSLPERRQWSPFAAATIA